jgi:hypothetical protein
MTVNKVIRDGKVAVLVSPGFGAGWSTWNSDSELLFDPTIVEMIEDGTNSETITQYCEAKYPDGYYGGAGDLKVQWLPVGTAFRIHEYDGSESVEIRDDINWITA